MAALRRLMTSTKGFLLWRTFGSFSKNSIHSTKQGQSDAMERKSSSSHICGLHRPHHHPPHSIRSSFRTLVRPPSWLPSFLTLSLLPSMACAGNRIVMRIIHRQWIYDGRRRIHHQPEEVDNLIQWNSHSGSPKTHVVQHAAYLKTFFPSILSKIP